MIDRQSIINAFANTPHPGDRRLCECDCEECQWEIEHFKNKKWSRLRLTDFGAEDGDANISFLTAEAFHYFLPGLLLLTMDHQDTGWLVNRIVSRLTVSDQESEERRERVRKVVTRLSSAQRTALLPVVRHWQDSFAGSLVELKALACSLHDGDVIAHRRRVGDLERVSSTGR